MRPVTINGGYVMRAWYDILIGAASAELSASLGRNEDAEGIRESQAEIEKLIAQEKQRGIAAKNIFLAGFSQGGAVVLYTGLRHKERLGGILALSTYLPLAQSLQVEADAQHLRTLIRNAQKEKELLKPPKSYRELFQVLRDVIPQPD